MYRPNFNDLLKVIERKPTERPVLFEFYISNIEVAEFLSGRKQQSIWQLMQEPETNIAAMRRAGFDYITMNASNFGFPIREIEEKSSLSLNAGATIVDRKTFESYSWLDPEKCDESLLLQAGKLLPKGMKIIVMGPCGVLENVVRLVGYDNLCYMMYDDPDLTEKIFCEVGQRFVRYYERCADYDFVGALISNDDWGFNSGTMISPDQLRRYVFPWHRKIVEVAHKAGKPIILHSCGNLDAVYDEIIDDLKYDAKHSNEDKILSVEEAYDKYSSRIAILGGIDVDFIIRSNDDAIEKRCKQMLEKSVVKGGYALGTGNSVAEYMPLAKYRVLLNTVKESRGYEL